MTNAAATEPVEAVGHVGIGDSDDISLEVVDTHKPVEEIVTINGDEVKKIIVVGIDRVEAVAVQDNGIETRHGTTMGDIIMGDGAVTVEGIKARQDKL